MCLENVDRVSVEWECGYVAAKSKRGQIGACGSKMACDCTWSPGLQEENSNTAAERLVGSVLLFLPVKYKLSVRKGEGALIPSLALLQPCRSEGC